MGNGRANRIWVSKRLNVKDSTEKAESEIRRVEGRKFNDLEFRGGTAADKLKRRSELGKGCLRYDLTQKGVGYARRNKETGEGSERKGDRTKAREPV